MGLEWQTARTDVLLLEFASQVALPDKRSAADHFLTRQEVGADLNKSRFSGATIANCRG